MASWTMQQSSWHNKFCHGWDCDWRYERRHHWFEGKRRDCWRWIYCKIYRGEHKIKLLSDNHWNCLGRKQRQRSTQHHKKNLDLRKIMDYCVTSKSWAIVNEDEKSRNNNRHQFRNQLQNLTPIPKIHNVPGNISTSVVDAMRAIRMILFLA